MGLKFGIFSGFTKKGLEFGSWLLALGGLEFGSWVLALGGLDFRVQGYRVSGLGLKL